MKQIVRLTESQLHTVIKESVKRIIKEDNQNANIWYHGGDKHDDLFYNNEIWLVDDAFYAYQYAIDRKIPCIWEVKVSPNVNDASVWDIGDCFDPYEGIDEDTRAFLDENGYDGYSFPLSWECYDYDCLVLKDKTQILSIRQLTQDEIQKISDCN